MTEPYPRRSDVTSLAHHRVMAVLPRRFHDTVVHHLLTGSSSSMLNQSFIVIVRLQFLLPASQLSIRKESKQRA